MNRFAFLIPLILSSALAVAAPGDPPAPARPAAAPVRTPLAQPAPVPGVTAVPRRPRTYDQCRVIALQRRLRGAERRHYMTRCQLGYGRPLFRRRGSIPAAGPAQPAAPAPVPAPPT